MNYTDALEKVLNASQDFTSLLKDLQAALEEANEKNQLSKEAAETIKKEIMEKQSEMKDPKEKFQALEVLKQLSLAIQKG